MRTAAWSLLVCSSLPAQSRPATAKLAPPFELQAPITLPADGVPFGNGVLGGLVGGEGRRLVLHLARRDGRSGPRESAMGSEGVRGVLTLELGDALGALEAIRLEAQSGEVRATCARGSVTLHALLGTPFLLVEASAEALQVVPVAAAPSTRPPLVVAEADAERPRTRLLVTLGLPDSPGATDAALLAQGRSLLARGGVAPAHAGRERWAAHAAHGRLHLPAPRIQAQAEFARYLLHAGVQAGGVPLDDAGAFGAALGEARGWSSDALGTSVLASAHALGFRGAGEAYTDWLAQNRAAFVRHARERYGVEGLLLPTRSGLLGEAQRDGGAESGALAACWTVFALWHEHRQLGKRSFLETSAYPWAREVGRALAALLERRDAGSGGGIDLATNHDRALLRWTFAALAAMARELDEGAESRRWERVLEGIPTLKQSRRGGPLAGVEHGPANAIAIHPLGLLRMDQGAEERTAVLATLAALDRDRAAWQVADLLAFAGIAARAAQGDLALAALLECEQRFGRRNGFLRGTTTELDVAATLAFLAVVHRLLLTSEGGVLQVFPALPAPWADVAFDELCAEGGVTVSARRALGRTTSVSLQATRPGLVRLVDPFGGKAVVWEPEPRAGAPRRVGAGYELTLGLGERITATVRL